jgi:hypothetical protein
MSLLFLCIQKSEQRITRECDMFCDLRCQVGIQIWSSTCLEFDRRDTRWYIWKWKLFSHPSCIHNVHDYISQILLETTDCWNSLLFLSFSCGSWWDNTLLQAVIISLAIDCSYQTCCHSMLCIVFVWYIVLMLVSEQLFCVVFKWICSLSLPNLYWAVPLSKSTYYNYPDRKLVGSCSVSM